MSLILPNVLIATSRSTFSGSTTSAPTTHLSLVAAHLSPVQAAQLATLPQEALGCQYRLKVDAGTDIVMNDTITAITLMDGVTVWPGFNTTAQYLVRFTQEQSPLILAYRVAYVEVILTGGKVF